MSGEPSWAALPAVIRAAQAGDYAALLRIARTAAGLTLAEAGRLAGYSASTMSRLETGRRRTCDAAELRRLAVLYGIPPDLVGLSPSSNPSTATSLGQQPDDGGDPMRRRDLLASTAAAATGAALLPLTAAVGDSAAGTIEDVLFGRVSAPPISAQQLDAQIAAARADFRACRYTQLAHRLPTLLARATASREQAPTDQQARATARLAHAYCLATQLLIKLHDDGMAWATADRAVTAARAAADPLVTAEATRLAATVLRRTRRRDRAQRLVLHAAQQLASETDLTQPAHATMHGQLLAVAAYTAATRDDRDAAHTLLGEADNAARRARPAPGDRFTELDLAVYRISVARVLGDYGTAVDHARLVDPSHITVPERRARYWEDTALALYGRGRPDAAYHALRTAERDTPQEVRHRPWAQQLTHDLLTTDTRNTLPGIREFAQRVGVSGHGI